ncbi:glycoside hydrolase/phage tail family protein [Brucella pseudogrignonensis]|uniref:baseplate multidomain protein megatron n=1 Tax=Brucella pseudogrignonensis TaxID=419475 RepID=UPI000CFD1317|nr:glycoside hydrolase/phage tail family protein [Brucella pseudogrignonensis]MQP41870.1 host specificity protein [Ochrobactrum sp. MYb237]PQZ42934.1 host specificity protein [Brucella pseudogrignonensis]PRA38086.1 host specificity protein [Brucella pseudogrignonensis]PRA63603.1 host specificity protein [Brucella pseudogrignonensis]
MATVVLQAVGAAVGGIFGPVGAAIGAGLGAMGGYAIDTAIINSTRHMEGARLNSGRVATAEEGAALPFVYGTARLSGTLIWATRHEEKKTTERQGGKGGPKVTSYSYFGNAAYAVAEGEIAGIRRVWADGQELDLTEIEMRIYHGTDTQQPDPLIEAKQGTGNAPAYRGTAYVVFERIPLDVYGNRLPQFQFEVLRPVGKLARDVRAVALIPGSTEFGLSPTPVTDRPSPGESRTLNRNAKRGRSDWMVAMDELQALCPQLQHVAIVLPWFGDDLRAGYCQIRPGVTHQSALSSSQTWKVESVTRSGAHLISQSGEGAAYGGTPSDQSVVDAIRDAKARGLKVTLYPFIMMDVPAGNSLPSPYGGVGQSVYPWRGRITCSPAIGISGSPDKTPEAADQVAAFVNGTWGYRRFLNHCASLAIQADGVDAFLLGSELRGLTSIRQSRDSFPFVTHLCTLAAEMRTKLGQSCRISYGADWTEYFGYQAQDGTGDLFFNLDALWAHPAINAIGIDNYMPLSDWRDGDLDGGNPDGFEGAYDLDGLSSNIEAGEGFDWYYANSENREQRKRTPITDGLAGKPWVYRYKDIRSWWSNPHYNRIDGAEALTPTAWAPQSKPIWFTELGCPAVYKGPNQPNVFPDPKSSENATPYFSNGARSDIAMDRFLRAHYHYWPDRNPVSSIYGGPMLDMDRVYLWSWDTRPFPEFPLKADVWGDTPNWRLGHWLNGRMSGVALDELIAAILADFGLPEADCTGADGHLTGFVISEPSTARGVLEPLMNVFGVHGFEQAGQFKFRSIGRAASVLDLAATLVEPTDGEALTAVLEDQGDLPSVAELYCNDPLRDFQVVGASVRRDMGQGTESLSLSGSMEAGQATALAEAWMARRYAERRTASFSLPWSEAALHVGDRVRLDMLGGGRDYVVSSLEDGEVRVVKAVALAPNVAFADRGETPQLTPGGPVSDMKPIFHLIDLPLWPGAEDPAGQFRIACHAKPWRGVATYASPSDDGFAERGLIGERAVMGELAAPLPGGASGGLIDGQTLELVLYSGELESKPFTQILNGANTALVQSSDGKWEVLQFLEAQEIGQNHWRLSSLLRGQLGTEAASLNEKPTGTPFILLDGGVQSIGLQTSEIGLELNWRIGAAGKSFSDDFFDTVKAIGGVQALKPLSPVHLKAERLSNNDLLFGWIRRGRVDADSWLGEEIPLGEEREAYQVEIWSSDVLVRSVQVQAASWTYPSADRLSDLGSSDFQLRVAMVSSKIGAGDFASINISSGI